MATVADRILDHLAEIPAGLDDGQLAAALGASRSTVNNACRRLCEQGRLFRAPGSSGVIVNRVIGSAANGVAEPSAAEPTAAETALVAEPAGAEPAVAEAVAAEAPAGEAILVDPATPPEPAAPEPSAPESAAPESAVAEPAAAEPVMTAPAAAVPGSDGGVDGRPDAVVEQVSTSTGWSQEPGRATADMPDSVTDKADAARSSAVAGAPEPDTEPAIPVLQPRPAGEEATGDAPVASKVGAPPVRRRWWRRFRKT